MRYCFVAVDNNGRSRTILVKIIEVRKSVALISRTRSRTALVNKRNHYVLCYFCPDIPNTLKNVLPYEQHLARLKQQRKTSFSYVLLRLNRRLHKQNRQNPRETGFTGSNVIAQFANLQAAKDWVAQDPYVEAGVYADVIVKPFKKSFNLNNVI